MTPPYVVYDMDKNPVSVTSDLNVAIRWGGVCGSYQEINDEEAARIREELKKEFELIRQKALARLIK